MALRDAVLAALLDGEASGYDLAKGFDASVANFWMATPQQLYRELDRMSAEGLIEARLVEQDRRPNKRLYSLTDAGRKALLEFTEVPPKPGAIREDLLVQIQAVDSGNIAAVRTALAERLQWATAKLARYRRGQEHLLAGRTEDAYLAEADRIGPYLTLLRGIRFEEENIEWARRALDVIEQRLAAADRPLR
ncbi:PadR family transcriptional regulator [Mycolicibacterium fortuitum]|jgi:DNA-binding PadR family transcriptional regulator|uniref:PadR family transcriptional regulator n=3 Tax=Mycolicibacterium fortuitum TaxID=1766 RepID=A0A0N9YIX2_MYCFO|nr:PadR family transcriptional regulator [Mycolicibacterium fortuitum]AIY49012.1 Transcriptional regulator, PadR family [Mycobacterium sp. VKM Ac-1817D]ALI29817.1 Transcriptional regulator, PadR family [Mycolicibacterium fortuitum]AMD56232.1 PadR family transcriptional regulator [Mycolicibacterium fortuitum subsp. fortuitum DSM 46621 = ATCC 6841 = JCM 6387]EJZ13921.1 PadR family transcriptional regulator [Mycolicibacterium fortuitum subsp. fortuitum DSM 46621 = ATCC 6841 = JCM 6387]MBP3083081.